MEHFNKIIRNGALLASGFAWLLFILSAFSDRVSPQFSVFFSYLGLFFPFIAVLNLFFLIGWILFRKWKYCLICLIVFLICSGAMLTYFPLHFKTKEIPTNCIKLLTYNVMQFEHEKPHKKGDPNGVLQYMIDSKADIICIQEYGAFTNGNHLNNRDVQKALNKYPHSRIYRLKSPNKKLDFGLAIFSKFPVLSIRSIPFKSDYNGAFVAELNIKGKKLTLINIHLESNKLTMEERTEYYSLTKEFDSHKLDTLTSKITNRLTPAFKIRAEQARIIAQIIRDNKNPYLIVCGDFNDTPISYARRTIKGDLEDAFVNSGSGLGTSYNRHRFLFRIDHMLHSKNIKAYNCTIDKIRYSDHYPLWSYLKLNDE